MVSTPIHSTPILHPFSPHHIALFCRAWRDPVLLQPRPLFKAHRRAASQSAQPSSSCTEHQVLHVLLLLMQPLALHRAGFHAVATPRGLSGAQRWLLSRCTARRLHAHQPLLVLQQPHPNQHSSLSTTSQAATMESSQAAASRTWKSHGSQQDFMLRDNCILVNDADAITGSANKQDAHRFSTQQPRGLLHRAFSMFLFDSKGRLLLQQRALDKITFPGVWTNTCCSHQLHGQEPAEIDRDEDIASGEVPGAKAAAVRKLEHELGIPPTQLPSSSLKFLTRLHYCAQDSATYGPNAPWGEHEIDYILVAQADVDITPNPEEVAAVKHVTLQELQAMMDPGSGLSWSPWFRIIARHFLPTWWADLPTTLASDTHVDVHTIHRLQCD